MGRLISLSDIDIRYMTAGVSSSHFDPYIKEAEELDIRPFLGDALYYALVSDVASSPISTKYNELLNGGTYTYSGETIEFKGIKMALQYYAYARYLANHEVVNTKSGQRTKTEEFSSVPSAGATQRRIDQAKSAGREYLESAKRFLDTKSSTYDLWGTTERNKPTLKFRVL